MFYNQKDVQNVRKSVECARCGVGLTGGPAITVYNGYKSNYYFCKKCDKYFKKNNITDLYKALKGK